ncbi:MAG: hypothetical protein ACREUW_02400 [Burkholderiales bacterium]
MNRRFIAFALVFLLGFAQHAALAHAIGHHAFHDGVALAHEGAPPPVPEGAYADCALDALYVQVLGGAGAFAVSSLPFVAPRDPAVVAHFLSAPPAAVLAAAPRGPPATALPL